MCSDVAYRSAMLALAALTGLIPTAIAHRRGRSLRRWWAFAAARLVAALPAALLAEPVTLAAHEEREIPAGMQACPFCHELVRRQLIHCRSCGRTLTGEATATT